MMKIYFFKALYSVYCKYAETEYFIQIVLQNASCDMALAYLMAVDKPLGARLVVVFPSCT